MKKTTTKEKKVEPVQETIAEEKRSAKATAKYLRISPQKMRLVIDTIRYQPATKAFSILMTLNRKAARMTEKVLKSAVANAKDLGLEEGRLYVSEVRADGGPTLKRFRPRSMGRADRILKRTTHLSVHVSEGKKNWLKSLEPEVNEEEKGSTKTKASKSKAAGTKKKKAAAAKA